MSRSLIVQSLRRRLPSSVSLLVAGVLAVGTAALAPMLQRSLEQQALHAGLATASDRDLRLFVGATTSATKALARDLVVGRLLGEVEGGAADAHFGPAHGSVVTNSRVTMTVAGGEQLRTRVGWAADGCKELQISTEACPSQPDQVAVSAADAKTFGVGVGARLGVQLAGGPTSLVVVAIYPVAAPTIDFGTNAQDLDLPGDAVPSGRTVSPLFVTPEALQTTFGGYNQDASVMRHLDRSTVDLDNEDQVRSAVAAAGQAALEAGRSDYVLSNVDSVLDGVDAQRRTTAVTVGLAAVQVVLITWVGLGVLVRAVTAARAPEFAVGSLRGLSGWQIARSASGATTALLVVAVPLGWLAATVIAAVFGSTLVGTGSEPEPLRWPVVAAVAIAFGGSVVTSVGAARRAVRTPVSSLLHRSANSDEPGRWGLAGEVAVVAVAVLTAVQLVRGGSLEADGQSGLGLLGPALVAVGAGVVVARISSVLLRHVTRRTPRRVTGLLASRRLAHAPGAVRGAVVLVAGAALAASAFDIAGIAERNRGLRAGQEVGAAEVLTVTTGRGVDLRAAVDAADPGGHNAMAAAQRTDPQSGVRLVAVDTDRYAAVAAVDPTWTDRPAADIAGRLRPVTAAPLELRGTSLRVDVSNVRVAATSDDDVGDGTDVSLPDTTGIQVETSLVAVVDDGSAWRDVDLGPVSAAAQSLSAPLACSAGCELIGLRLDADFIKARFAAQLTVTGVGTDALTVARSAAVLAEGSGWTAPALLGSDLYSVPTTTVQAAADGLHLTLTDPVGDPGNGPEVLRATRPAELPVLVGTAFGQNPLNLEAPAILGAGLDGAPSAYSVRGTSTALPRVGAIGVLMDLRIAAAASDPSALTGTVSQVWVARPDTVPALTRALAARGVTVTATQTAEARRAELAALTPARAFVVAELAAVAGLGLALLVALSGLLAAGRNRLYELASLRAAGIRGRTLRRSIMVELSTLLGAAAVLGAAVGLLVAGLSTAGLTFYADGSGPPLDINPDTAAVGWLLGVAVLVVAAVSGVTATALERAARPSRLRESIR